MKLLTDTQLRQFDDHLASVCGVFLSDVESKLLANRLLSYVQNGGKRIRPQLVIWTYLHATQEASSVDNAAADQSNAIDARNGPTLPTAVLDVAAAWELFHAFLLVHDDIIDGSDKRRGQPSLHRQLQSLDSDSPRFGANLGIVAGDLFYAWVNQLLGELDVPAEAYRQIHKLFARVATTTGLGQAVDVLQSHAPIDRRDEATLLREYSQKTAAYTFEGPMLTAAILAGLPGATHDAISRYALCLGQAYQMQNDLLDLVRPVTEGSDLVEGKHTYTLLKAREFLTETDRQAFDGDLGRILASNGRAIELAESVRQRLLKTPAVRCTADRIVELLDGCLCDADTLPPSLKAAMAGALEQLKAKYFAATAG